MAGTVSNTQRKPLHFDSATYELFGLGKSLSKSVLLFLNLGWLENPLEGLLKQQFLGSNPGASKAVVGLEPPVLTKGFQISSKFSDDAELPALEPHLEPPHF